MITHALNMKSDAQVAPREEVVELPPGAALIKQLRLWGGQALIRWWHRPISTSLARLSLRAWGASAEEGFCVRGRLRLYLAGQIRIGRNVRINSGAANFVGGDRRMALWVGPKGRLVIDEGCALSNSTIVCHHEITLLSHTFIGGGCELYDTDFHPLHAEVRIAGHAPAPGGGIRIGPQAFLGARSIVLKNVVIGEGAVVAAGSVVTRSIPPHELWGGIPARLIRKLS